MINNNSNLFTICDITDDVDGANSRPSPVREKWDRGAGEEVLRSLDSLS